MKTKMVKSILSFTLAVMLFLGMYISVGCNRSNSVIEKDTEFNLITMECDGPDGVMLQ